VKILIAYDGSGYAHTSLDDLQHAGLPSKADVLVISIAEAWLSPKTDEKIFYPPLDNDIIEYFQTHSQQMDRNLAETKTILVEAKEKLQRNFPGWDLKTDARAGSPAQVVLRRAAEFKPDLIVVGAQGLSSDGVSGIGSVSQKIISESHFPVRVARSNPETDAMRLKIDICFDGSPGSMETVKAVALRFWRGQPEIRLLVVTDPMIAVLPGRVLQVIQGMPEDGLKGERKWIESLTAKAVQMLENVGITTSIHIYSGNPRTMLVAESKKWKSDTIFIGTRSSQTQSHSLGCVALAVVTRASCTVETISNS
jgi:nucleotide-binding universal stress UspA family protein